MDVITKWAKEQIENPDIILNEVEGVKMEGYIKINKDFIKKCYIVEWEEEFSIRDNFTTTQTTEIFINTTPEKIKTYLRKKERKYRSERQPVITIKNITIKETVLSKMYGL